MNIRVKLTFLFALVTASILLIFSTTIYYFSANYRENQFKVRLKDKAMTSARLLLEIEEIDQSLLKLIEKNTTVLPQEVVEVYDDADLRIYRSREPANFAVELPLLRNIKSQGIYFFKNGIFECVGLVYHAGHKDFIVIASAFDQYGLNRLRHLLLLQTISFFVGIGVIFAISYFVSGIVFRPIMGVITQVEKISFFNLNHRVSEGNGKDEIATLAITFNQMLDRLATAFQVQRSFVSNASHELRTPLTAIMTQIEVTLMSQRTTEEYRDVLNSLLEDLRSLIGLTNGLLYLAQVDIDISQLKFTRLRVDDLLWQVQQELLKRNGNYRVSIEFSDLPNDEESLYMSGNENLLKTAFVNLMDNACKYSADQYAQVQIGFSDKTIELEFIDKGIGIPPSDIEKVTLPFYRGENAAPIKGHGLGLSLVKKIVDLHQGKFRIKSELGKGTRIRLGLPMAGPVTTLARKA